MSEVEPEIDDSRVFLGLGDYVFELIVPEELTPEQMRSVLRQKLGDMEKEVRMQIGELIREQISEEETADANRALGKVAYLVETVETRRDM